LQTNIKSINEFLGLKFFIPSYQRGYRWDEHQVTELLDDIWDFYNIPNKSEGEFYCLQPVIVKLDGDSYRLIDGQQRLTTIFIILSCLDLYMQDYGFSKFNLEYETREDSEEFLEKLLSIDKEDTTNIDFYYMSKAYLCVQNWFDKYRERKIKFFDTLVNINNDENNNDRANNVRVIWYEIAGKEDEINVFTRINSGKIPLTNAELIKALFLNSKNFDGDDQQIRQIEIAKEWDEMEYSLQDDEFWMFIANDKDYPARIELLFDIYSNQISDDKDQYSTYRFFVKQKDIINTWSSNEENIKKIFLTLKYWYDNRELYHLIGFIIATKIMTLRKLYIEFKSKTKKEFYRFLHKLIQSNISLDRLEELEYGPHNQAIHRVLLLFNIATILNNKDSYIRFSFDKFNSEKWSLEHIHAQQDKGLLSLDSKKAWIIEIIKQIELLISNKIDTETDLENILNRVNNMYKSDKIDDEDFQSIQNTIFSLFGEDSIDTIDNLALLTTGVNSALSNSIFPIKRNILKEKDSQGEFIPICTKNVFMKYYSQDSSNMYFWSEKDRKDYIEQIRLTVEKFLGSSND
jgi:uncharacterized protein with ParB-like and HNH nuclease domain